MGSKNFDELPEVALSAYEIVEAAGGTVLADAQLEGVVGGTSRIYVCPECGATT